MGDSKGKGRALPREEDTNSGQSGDEPLQGPSLISRVAASASGLSRSALGAPNNNELNESVARALQNANKGLASSSGGSSGWAESSTTQQHSHQTGGCNTFRAGQNEHHMRQSEDEFSSFLDGIDSFSSAPSDVVGVGYLASGQFGDASLNSQLTGELENASESRHVTIHEQESRDGEDVLALLSEPSNLPPEAPQDDEDYDWGLSAKQISQLRAMTKDLLPPQEPHIAISPDNPLNLAPRFDESRMSSGTQEEVAIAQENWREQWEGVLTRYSDEVWGGLLPLVKEARKEVEDLRKILLDQINRKVYGDLALYWVIYENIEQYHNENGLAIEIRLKVAVHYAWISSDGERQEHWRIGKCPLQNPEYRIDNGYPLDKLYFNSWPAKSHLTLATPEFPTIQKSL